MMDEERPLPGSITSKPQVSKTKSHKAFDGFFYRDRLLEEHWKSVNTISSVPSLPDRP